jgi:hypothetical protein
MHLSSLCICISDWRLSTENLNPKGLFSISILSNQNPKTKTLLLILSFKVPAIQTAWCTICKYLALDPWTCSLVFKTSIGVVKKALRPANHQAYDLVSNSEP